MAEYIDDSGAWGFDALLSGTKATDYNYDDTNKLIWFSSTGTASSGLTLPTTEWILYEVYAPDSYANNLTGGTTVQSKKEYTTTIGTIGTTLNTWYDTFEAATAFATFKIKATHYKGSNTADVYFADANTTNKFLLTGGTEEGITDGTFILSGFEWVMSDDLLADDVTPIEYLDTEWIEGDRTPNSITSVVDTTVTWSGTSWTTIAAAYTLTSGVTYDFHIHKVSYTAGTKRLKIRSQTTINPDGTAELFYDEDVDGIIPLGELTTIQFTPTSSVGYIQLFHDSDSTIALVFKDCYITQA